MVASPSATPNDPWARLAALERTVAALENKNLFSAVVSSGGLTINNGGGITVNGGKIVIGPGGSIQLPAGGTITDAAGNILFSADALTGQRLSTPYLAVPLTPRWSGGRFQTNTGTGDFSIPASSVTAETTLWEGEIPQILHPKAIWSGNLGRVTGTTSVPTYKLYVNNVLVDTYSQTSYAFHESAPLDITGVSVYGVQIAPVRVTIQADVTSTDDLACTVYNVTMAGN